MFLRSCNHIWVGKPLLKNNDKRDVGIFMSFDKEQLEPEIPLEPPVHDHLLSEQESVCGYCGYAFSGNESRIEKNFFGVRWVFCSEQCLNNFKDASNYLESEQDPDGVHIRHGSGDDEE